MASLSDEIEARLDEKTRQLAETMGWSYDDAKRTVYSALNAEFSLAEMSARAGVIPLAPMPHRVPRYGKPKGKEALCFGSGG